MRAQYSLRMSSVTELLCTNRLVNLYQRDENKVDLTVDDVRIYGLWQNCTQSSYPQIIAIMNAKLSCIMQMCLMLPILWVEN